MGKTTPKDFRLVWVDLEMTGLDPRTDRIIEIASLITDSELNIIAKGPELVIYEPKESFAKMDDWNQKQHKKSGLWDLVVASKMSREEAGLLTLDFIKTHTAPKQGILAGNSIWQDRRFIQKSWPSILDHLHYRLLDVSAIKLISQFWYPNKTFKKKDGHRSLSDIMESLAELAYYRTQLFKTTDRTSLEL